jgi:hypothetical protein
MNKSHWQKVIQDAKRARAVRWTRFQRGILKLAETGTHAVIVQQDCYNPYNENNVEGLWLLVRCETWMKAAWKPEDTLFSVDNDKSPFVLVQFEKIRTDLDFHGHTEYNQMYLNDDDLHDPLILEKIKTYLEDQTLDESQTLELVNLIAENIIRKYMIVFAAIGPDRRPADKLYYFDNEGAISGILEFSRGNLLRVPLPPKSTDHLNKTMVLTDMDSERYSGLTTRNDAKPFAVSSSYKDDSEDFYSGLFYYHEFDIDDITRYLRKYSNR